MKLPADMREHETDIQALVGTGFPSLRKARYLFLRIADPAKASKWIGERLGQGMIRSMADLGSDRQSSNPRPAHADALLVAFTYSGLRAMGLGERRDFPFPTVFRKGMANIRRKDLFGDDPAKWMWCDRAHTQKRSREVHVLLAYFAQAMNLPGCLTNLELNQAGLSELTRIENCPSYIDPVEGGTYEPFGFRDGVAQPVMRGLRESKAAASARQSAGPMFEDRTVASGEFLLGHVNEYGEIARCPDARWKIAGGKMAERPFGLNGSYLVVRQIEQAVEKFLDCERANPSAPRETVAGAAGAPPAQPSPVSVAPSVGEKMIGRKRDGSSLVQCPMAVPEIDAFRYRVNDADGFQCPAGAHVRRANPRDLLGWDVESGITASKLHRLIRRGRVWAKTDCANPGGANCGDKEHRDPDSDRRCGQGLVFIALNADLERQYEFIQQNWMMNRRFGNLSNEQDPILGNASPRRFTIPAIPVGKALAGADGLDNFTKVIGGGYFFLPGLAALGFIAAGPTPA